MKNLKTIGGVLVIIGGLFSIVGVLLPNFEKENKINLLTFISIRDKVWSFRQK